MMEKDGYIFVYSMTSKHSLDELQHFYVLHQQINEVRINEHRSVPIVLVANKKDLVDGDTGNAAQVPTEMGKEQAMQWGAKYIETSAFNGENVEQVFKTFIQLVREGRSPKPPAPTGFCSLL